MLEVKLRSSQVQANRARLLALSLGAVFVLLFSLYLVWRSGEWALNALVYENDAFGIREIDIQTDGVLAPDQLRRWAGVKPEDNLLALDLALVKRNLELMPVVQSASVERILPRTLRIHVIEREPIAQVNAPHPRAGGGIETTTVLLDPEGYVMLPIEPRQQRAPPPTPATEQFPIISGVNLNELQPGHRLDSAQAQAALQLIIAFQRSQMAGLVDLRRIDISNPGVLLATTGQGSEVTFGMNDLDQQLRRWHEIFELGQRMSKAIFTLDLAITNNIPARWLEASAVPPLTPKASKPLRIKKKHV